MKKALLILSLLFCKIIFCAKLVVQNNSEFITKIFKPSEDGISLKLVGMVNREKKTEFEVPSDTFLTVGIWGNTEVVSAVGPCDGDKTNVLKIGNAESVRAKITARLSYAKK